MRAISVVPGQRDSVLLTGAGRARAFGGERLLFKTSNSVRCWQADGFVEDFVYSPEEAAIRLARAGVRTDGAPARALLRPFPRPLSWDGEAGTGASGTVR